MRLRVSLGIGLTNVFTGGVLVRRVKVLVVEAGSCVRKICGALFGFKPSDACACGGSVPSGRKFTSEANTRLDGWSDAL